MNTSFRLISEILVFINGDQLFISSPDNKICLGKIKKMIASFGTSINACKELTISPENFKVKLVDDFQFLVSSKELPGGLSKYYKIMNLDIYGSYLTELFNNTDFSKGDWSNIFEMAIRDSDGKVRLLCPEMPSFEKASNEMIRVMNCKLFKKTRKFIPGHRYDTEDSTIYYIGKVYSHTVGSNSEYFTVPTEETHLFVENKGSATKLSEVLKNGIIDGSLITTTNRDDLYLIKASNNLKSMVDSGEVLENDLTCFEDYIPEILENSIGYRKQIENSTRSVLDIFRYNTVQGNTYTYSTDIINKLTTYIKLCLLKYLYRFWDIKSKCTINPSDSIDKQAVTLSSIFINNIVDGNLKKTTYYKQIFSELGIDLDKLSEGILTGWDPSILKNDFEVYKETSSSRGNNYSVQLRTSNSCKYSLTKTIISDFIKNQDLKDLIFDLIKYIRNNGGYGASSYNIINAGNSSRPLMYEQIVIGIDDIINYHKEKGIEMPENLKYSIIEDKLNQLSISVDLGGDIE